MKTAHELGFFHPLGRYSNDFLELLYKDSVQKKRKLIFTG